MVRFFLKSILARYREMRDRLAVSADARRLRAIGDASTPAPSRGPDRDYLRASSILRQDVRLRTAFKANELEVFAQPIHDAASGKPVAAEMLVRWRNPRRGLLGADSVIPAAERSGLIVEIGYWILEQACGYIARLDAEYRERGRHNPMRYFSVNVSPRQFDDEHFVDKAEVIMHAHGVDPGRITFEITESMILQESKRTESQLPRLKALGCGIALDDFGTGYSSLTHMLKFPIDTLKIDRSFVSRMNNDAKAKNIVASLIALSQNLGIHVIAEGAEREADLLSLRAMGCGSVQGYLYSAPLKLEELSEYLGTF